MPTPGIERGTATAQLITDPGQIAATQRHLESVLRADASWTGRRRIANANNMELGGCELNWHGRGRFWSTATGNLRGRWCNAFGVDDPRELPAVRNTVWINPRESGVEGRAFAAFARDADGHRLLLHTGRLGGGHEGVTRAAFLRSGEYRQVQADSREFVVVDTREGAPFQGIWPPWGGASFDSSTSVRYLAYEGNRIYSVTGSVD